MPADLFQITWAARPRPLAPVAAAATGKTARQMARHLLKNPSVLERLEGVASPDLLIVIGNGDLLPWEDGVVYLGRDPAAPSLLLPTSLAPSIPAGLLERAVTNKFPSLKPPFALLPSTSRVISLAAARPIDANILRAWLEGKT
jgi:hypothetical protein